MINEYNYDKLLSKNAIFENQILDKEQEKQGMNRLKVRIHMHIWCTWGLTLYTFTDNLERIEKNHTKNSISCWSCTTLAGTRLEQSSLSSFCPSFSKYVNSVSTCITNINQHQPVSSWLSLQVTKSHLFQWLFKKNVFGTDQGPELTTSSLR